MPVKPCSKNGKRGLKYGDDGACYTDKNKKSKVNKQRIAIEISRHKKKGK